MLSTQPTKKSGARPALIEPPGEPSAALGHYTGENIMRVAPQSCQEENGLALQLQVSCLDTLDRIRALTYTLGQLARVEAHCTLHSFAIVLLTEMMSQECDALREMR